MIKYFFSIMLSLLGFELGYAQIPNGSFESWETVNNYEIPSDWSTNQSALHPRFEKDSISIDGQYSLKIISSVTSYWEGCTSHAGIHVDFNNPLPSNSALTFYVKILPMDPIQDTGVYLIVLVNTFVAGIQTGGYDWWVPTSMEEFTKVGIPLITENIDAVSILIFGGASSHPADGPCGSRSITWIDGMDIETGTSDGFSPFLNKPNVSIYPNPSNGLINIRHVEGKRINYELYSLLGEFISKGQIENEELAIQEKGTYMLRLFVDEKDRSVFTSKLIVVQ